VSSNPKIRGQSDGVAGVLFGTWSTISKSVAKEDKKGIAAEKIYTSRINVNYAPHLIRIGKVQASAEIVPVVRHIEMDGTRLDSRTRLLKPIKPHYRFLPGMLLGQRISRNIGLNRIMMFGIGYQIVI
jgi:hypothetical protein